jgi:hypothetical protein
MASRRGQRRRLAQVCAGKVRHETHQAAGFALFKLRTRVGAHHDMHVYKCSACGGWHVGHARHKHTRKNYRGNEGLL